MKNSTIMPDIIIMMPQTGLEDVCFEPGHLKRAITQALPGDLLSSRRNIQYCNVFEASLKQVVNQGGSPAAHIDNLSRSIYLGTLDELQRQAWMYLIPANPGWRFRSVNGVPM